MDYSVAKETDYKWSGNSVSLEYQAAWSWYFKLIWVGS